MLGCHVGEPKLMWWKRAGDYGTLKNATYLQPQVDFRIFKALITPLKKST